MINDEGVLAKISDCLLTAFNLRAIMVPLPHGIVTTLIHLPFSKTSGDKCPPSEMLQNKLA